MGASATQTGLGAPEGAEPHPRLGASPAIPCAAKKVGLKQRVVKVLRDHDGKPLHVVASKILAIPELGDAARRAAGQ